MSAFDLNLEVVTSILNEFVTGRNNDYLTNCLLQPNASVKVLREQKRDYLQNLLKQFLADKSKSLNELKSLKSPKDYYYFLHLGAIYLALEDYQQAAERFKVAMQFSKINSQAETDGFFELPCLLAGASYELAGDFKNAIEVYHAGANYGNKSDKAGEDCHQSITRCQRKLENQMKVESKEPLNYLTIQQSTLKSPPKQDFSRESLFNQLELNKNEPFSIKQFASSCFSGLSPLDEWNVEREAGWPGLENSESNSIAAMMNASKYIVEQSDKPITVDTVRAIHTMATNNFSESNRKDVDLNESVILGTFGTTMDDLRISIGYNATIDGINELMQSIENQTYYSMGTETNLSALGTLNFKYLADQVPVDVIEMKISQALEEYQTSLAQLKDKDDYIKTIRIIVRCVKTIELAHPFRDFSGISVTTLLNMMLLQNHLPPVILKDPNYFDGYSTEELINEVLDGMEHFVYVKKHGCYTESKTTIELSQMLHTRSQKSDFYDSNQQVEFEQASKSLMNMSIVNYSEDKPWLKNSSNIKNIIKAIKKINFQVKNIELNDEECISYLLDKNNLIILLKFLENFGIGKILKELKTSFPKQTENLAKILIESGCCNALAKNNRNRQELLNSFDRAEDQELLFNQFLLNDPAVYSLIESSSDFTRLAKTNPYVSPKPYVWLMSDIKRLNKVIQSDQDLANVFEVLDPAQQMELYSSLFKDENKFEIIFKNAESFKMIVSKAPSLKKLVFERLMNSRQLFSFIVKPRSDVDMLLETFNEPDYQDKIMNYILSNEIVFANVFRDAPAFNNVLGKAPLFKEVIFEQLMSSNNLLRTVLINNNSIVSLFSAFHEPSQQSKLLSYCLDTRTIDTVINSSDDLTNVLKVLGPVHQMELYKKLFQNEEKFNVIFIDAGSFKKIITILPEVRNELFEKINSKNKLTKLKVSNTNIIDLLEAFNEPSQQLSLLISLFETGIIYLVIRNSDDLANVLTVLGPVLQMELWKRLFKDQRYFAIYFKDVKSFKNIITILPLVRNELFEKIKSKDNLDNLIVSNRNFIDLVEVFNKQDQQEILIKFALSKMSVHQLFNSTDLVTKTPYLKKLVFESLISSEKLFSTRVETCWDFNKLLEIFSESDYQQAIIAYICTHEAVYNLIFRDVPAFRNVLIKTPAHKDAIFERLMSLNYTLKKFLIDNNSLVSLLDTFSKPALQLRLISYLFEQESLIPKCITSDNDVKRIFAKFQCPDEIHKLFKGHVKLHEKFSGVLKELAPKEQLAKTNKISMNLDESDVEINNEEPESKTLSGPRFF